MIRLCLFVFVLAGGCAASPPDVDAEGAISAALGAAEPVVFRFEGAPLDVASGSQDLLSSADAIQRAVEASPELQVSLARVRAAQAEAELAGLLPNPVLSLVVRFPEGGGKAEVEAGLAADLLAILQRPGRARTAGHRLEAEAANALASALDVVADVQQEYSRVQALEALLPVLEERESLLERLREVAAARLDAGEAPRADVTALDAERSTLAVEAAERRRDLRLARLALAKSIGEPSSSATWSLDAWDSTPILAVDEQDWIDSALARRPEILAVVWELRAREEEEALAGGDALSGASAGLEAERDDVWSAGPSIATPLPVFDTGRARRERARALTAEQRHRLTDARRVVVEEVRSSLESLVSTQDNLARVEGELIPLQERRRAEAEEAYRLGLADVTALLFADEALKQTQARRVDLAHEAAAARTRLERSVGGPAALIGGSKP